MKISRTLLSLSGTLALLAAAPAAWAQAAPVAAQPPAATAPGSAQAPVDPTAVSAEAATPAPAPPAVQPAALPPPAPAPLSAQVGPLAPEPLTLAPTAPSPPSPAFPTKLAIGKEGWIQVGGLIQAWYDVQWNAGRGMRNTKSTFKMRRAEIKVSGDIIKDRASFMLVIDPAATLKFSTKDTSIPSASGAPQTLTTYNPPGNTSILKAAYVTVKSSFVEASLGQFRHPFGLENQQSSAELLFAERSFVSRYFGDLYDMGVRLEKKFDYFKYQVLLLNGSGQNQIDTNKQKDLVARLDITPVEGVSFSTAGWTTLGQRSSAQYGGGTKDRVEVSGRFNKEGFLLQGELMWGKLGSTASYNEGTKDERTKAAGRYIAAGYTIAKRLQPVIRYGYVNTDRTTTRGQASTQGLNPIFGLATDEVRSYEAGINYYLQGNELKILASYGYYDFDNIPALQEFTLVGQAAF